MHPVDIRLKGLAGISNGANQSMLESHTGYHLLRDGDDWLIPCDDLQLKAGPRDFLTTQEPQPLKSDLGKAATACVATLSDAFEMLPQNIPSRLPHFEKFGFSAEFYQKRLRYGFCQRRKLKDYLVKELFPFAKQELNAKYVAPIAVDAKYLQALISLPKIVYFLTEYGPTRTQELLNKKRGLDKIIPSPILVPSYCDALLMVSPSVIAIPFERPGSALYFMRDQAWSFPYVATSNLLEKMQSGVDPIVQGAPRMPLRSILTGKNIRIYVSVVIEALQSAIKFLNDPRNFINSNNELDFKRILLANSGMRLILHEISESAVTGSEYVRQRLAFNVVDKYANLRSAISSTSLDENSISGEVFTEGFRDQLISICRATFNARSNKLAQKFVGFIYSVYEPILRKPDRSVRTTEEIRGIRNLNHGVFLNRDQFAKVFIDGDGAMPHELVYLPYLIGLGLIFNPCKMLSMP